MKRGRSYDAPALPYTLIHQRRGIGVLGSSRRGWSGGIMLIGGKGQVSLKEHRGGRRTHVAEQEMEGGSVQSPEQRRDALVERIFGSCIGFMEILSIYVGDRLGFYRALADYGGATASQLADATG